MADPFVAEIRVFGFNFAPQGWAFCNGQVLPISQNTALFSLLGTTYGGNGTSNFSLPNLQGSFAIGFGQGPGLSLRDLGETGGEAAVTLLATEIPVHSHGLKATAGATTANPSGSAIAPPVNGASAYHVPGTLTAMSTDSLGQTGGSQPHNNLPPYLTMNFCIALQGIYPPRS